MGDRNEYMREYMRSYRAAKRAAAGAGEIPGDNIAVSSTELGQELTEPGVYARYKWAWWLLGGVVLGLCLYAITHVSSAPPALNSDTTEPETTEGQEHHQTDNTEPETTEELDNSTEPETTEGQEKEG